MNKVEVSAALVAYFVKRGNVPSWAAYVEDADAGIAPIPHHVVRQTLGSWGRVAERVKEFEPESFALIGAEVVAPVVAPVVKPVIKIEPKIED